MIQDIEKLRKNFERIKNMGWVRETKKGNLSIGATFEALIGKERDELPIPDFGCVEIKTMNDNSKTRLHLFNLKPDGDCKFPIKRILECLVCPDKDNKECRVFYRSFNSKKITKIGKFKDGKIFVNRENEKIELLVYNEKCKNININVSWSFSWIEKRLMQKLRYLAIIRAAAKIVNGIGYYHYHKINFYKLKDFDTFLFLIENGIIEITFKIGVFKKGRRKGEVHDHGTDFSINIDNIDLLYDEISNKEMVK